MPVKKKNINHIYSLEELFSIIIPILHRYNAKNALIFGSYARKEATADSDIDVIVNGGESFDPTDIFCIADDLYRATGKNVDVYESREIGKNSHLQESINRDGVEVS